MQSKSIRGPAHEGDAPSSVELVSLLQDTLLCGAAVDTCGLTPVLTAPLTL